MEHAPCTSHHTSCFMCLALPSSERSNPGCCQHKPWACHLLGPSELVWVRVEIPGGSCPNSEEQEDGPLSPPRPAASCTCDPLWPTAGLSPPHPASCLMRRGAQLPARWWWRAAPRVTPDQFSSLSQPLSPKPICV